MKKAKEQQRKNSRTKAEAERSGMKRATVSKGIQYDNVTKKYIVTFYSKLENKKPTRSAKSFVSLRDAEQALAEHKADQTRRHPENIRRTMTLTECIGEFLNASVNENRIVRTTEKGYRVIQRRIASAPVGSRKIIALKADDITNYMKNSLDNLGLKPVTINKDLDLIRGALRYAEEKRYISSNPAKAIRPFTEEPPAITPLTLAEVHKVKEAVEASGNPVLKVCVLLGMYQGLRRGEMVGLRWCNVDFEKNVIQIKETRTQVGGELIDKAPKTKSSKRDAFMSPAVASALLECKKWQEKTGIAGEYVVTTPTGARYNPTDLSHKVSLFMDKLGLPHVGLHALRHTFATLAVEKGAPINAVSGALGHSHVSTTMRVYTHASRDASKTVTEAMKDFFI